MKRVTMITALIVLMISMTSCWKHVPPKNVGIKVKTLGQNKGVEPVTLPVGRYFIGVNWTLYLYPTSTHIYPFTAGNEEGSEIDEAMKFQDKDGLPLSCDVAVSARVDPDKVTTAFQNYNGEMQDIIKTYVRQDLLNAFIAYASTQKAENLYSDKKMDMIASVTKTLSERYAPTGVIITDVAYKSDIRLPDNVMQAINQKIGATQIALKKEQEVMQAEADAKSAVAKATGEANAILLIAQAQAKANRLLSESITPTLTNYILAKGWNGVSPQYSGTGIFPALFK